MKAREYPANAFNNSQLKTNTDMKTKVYIFPYDEKRRLCLDTTGKQLIEFLIGQTLREAFQADDNPTRGIQYVRIKHDMFEIVAQKRLNDVKVLIYEK